MSQAERHAVVNFSIYPLTKRRVEYLERKIQSLGGFAKRERWPAKNTALIEKLRADLARERRELCLWKSEYKREVKANENRPVALPKNRRCNFRKVKTTIAMPPHLLANLFNTTPKVIYRVWDIYIKTGNILFCGDINRYFAESHPQWIAGQYGNSRCNLACPTYGRKQHPSIAQGDDEFDDESDMPPIWFKTSTVSEEEKLERILRAQRRAKIASFAWLKQTRAEFNLIARSLLN